MEVILLERVGRLGVMGDTVKVRDGYARNFLLPQKKALRATQDNKALFDAKREHLAAENEKLRKEAEARAKKINGLALTLVRQASEDGRLYGSVTPRDVAQALADAGHAVERSQVPLAATIKTTGVYTVAVALHPEVSVNVTVTIVRNESEVVQEVPEELRAPEEPAAANDDAE